MNEPIGPPLRSPQFSLRTLFLALTLIACLCALANAVSPLIFAGVVFLILSISAHIIGNSLGTFLSDHAARQRAAEPKSSSPAIRPNPRDFAPPTQLGQRRTLGLLVLAITLAGVVGGGALSVVCAIWLYTSPTRADLVVIGVAGAVLGGIWTFAIASFLHVGSSAVWQAIRDQKRTTPDKENPQP